MEREELLQQVTESIEGDGKKLSSTLSEESINGELDDALEDITEDEEKNKTVIAKLAKRLLRMDGNLHSNVSKEVNEYKKAHPAAKKPSKNGEGNGGDDDKSVEKLLARIEAMENAQKERETKAAKDATIGSVREGLKAAFKKANVEVNEYILRQTIRDVEIPDGDENVDVDGLIKQTEKAYYKNLKEAGLDKKESGKPRFGQGNGNKGESAADRFFKKKAAKEGWKK